MVFLKYFSDYLRESFIEKTDLNISVSIDDVISSLGDNINLFEILNINKDVVNTNGDINDLFLSSDFNHSLSKKKLKKSKLEDTSYDQTLLKDGVSLRFFYLLDIDSVQIDEPTYIILQYIDQDEKSPILSYKNTSINNFLKKLTDYTLELSNGKENYIYQTNNGGNDWSLRNVQMETNDFKNELDKDSLINLINKLKLEIL